MENNNTDTWYEEDNYTEESQESLQNYSLSYSPNDFNVKTNFDFIEKGIFKIPNFQRNYVWDIKKASKLIESLILGLPIPQIFLFEQSKNNFLVIDGQQRLMSLYYFIKGRFPRQNKRTELRNLFASKGSFDEDILEDKTYFTDFTLKLPNNKQDKHPLHGLDYDSLNEEQMTFDLRPIRSIIIKPNSDYDNYAIYEIFNRLNSGGVNLNPQEIRNSLFHSPFYDMLHQLNLNPTWRKLIHKEETDLHMKDVEFILRCFALLLYGEAYTPSMLKFLDDFSKKAQNFDEEKVSYFKQLFKSFLEKMIEIDEDVFIPINTQNKVSIAYMETLFRTLCLNAVNDQNLEIKEVNSDRINELKHNEVFHETITKNSTSKANVQKRLEIAQQYLLADANITY